MRILLWHGYLLSGSGSNIYTANVARCWREAGHDVLLICQESDAATFGFVDEEGGFASTNDDFSLKPTGVRPVGGRCRVARPDIGGLLPVYVYDDYDGFIVKRFVDLSDDELATYTNANIKALVTAVEEHDPEVIITGHEVMGPYIALEACRAGGRAYTAKLHGSALEYAVKVQSRYVDFARAGLSGARRVVGGSAYMVRAASEIIPGWDHKSVVINPGCDTELFVPRPKSSDVVRVGFVGKLIAAKGVHHLLAALGLVGAQGVRAVIVGYGGFEESLRSLASALARGDRETAMAIALTGDDHGSLDDLVSFLSSDVANDEGYWARAARVEVEFPGRLDHEPLAELLPTLDVLVVPSVVPEAFGMVAAEAAACGVLPVVPRHSGIGEVGMTLEKELERPGLLTFDPAQPVAGIAARVDGILRLSDEERRRLGLHAAEVARRRWSWAVVAERLLAVARD